MKHRIKRRKSIFLVLLVLIVAVPAILICAYANGFIAEYRHEVNIVSINELLKPGNDALPVRVSGGEGTYTKLSANLPESITTGTELYIYSNMQEIQVFLDGVRTYDNTPNVGGTVQYTRCWHVISVPEYYAGTELVVSLRESNGVLIHSIYDIYLGTPDEVVRTIINRDITLLMVSLMTLAAGGLAMVLGFFRHDIDDSGAGVVTIRRSGYLLEIVGILGIMNITLWGFEQQVQHICTVIQVVLICLIPLILIQLFLGLTVSDDFRKEESNFMFLYAISLAACIVFLMTDRIKPGICIGWFLLLSVSFIIYISMFGFAELQSARRPEYRRKLYSEMLNSVVIALLLIVLLYGVYVFTYMGLSENGRWFVFGEVVCFMVLWIIYIDRIISGTHTLWKMEEELEQSQIRLMLSQIKPHFLYNTLNSIRALIRKSPEEADALVYHFSHFLHDNMVNINSVEPIPFHTELEHIREYISIEQAVYEKLKVEYNTSIQHFKVPPLTIQPLVENAIKHGIRKKVDGGTLTLETFENDDSYQIVISDDGVGFDPEEVDDTRSFGLKNVKMRLEYYCDASLVIDSVPGEGTRVYVIIPKKRKLQSGTVMRKDL